MSRSYTWPDRASVLVLDEVKVGPWCSDQRQQAHTAPEGTHAWARHRLDQVPSAIQLRGNSSCGERCRATWRRQTDRDWRPGAQSPNQSCDASGRWVGARCKRPAVFCPSVTPYHRLATRIRPLTRPRFAVGMCAGGKDGSCCGTAQTLLG